MVLYIPGGAGFSSSNSSTLKMINKWDHIQYYTTLSVQMIICHQDQTRLSRKTLPKLWWKPSRFLYALFAHTSCNWNSMQLKPAVEWQHPKNPFVGPKISGLHRSIPSFFSYGIGTRKIHSFDSLGVDRILRDTPTDWYDIAPVSYSKVENTQLHSSIQ